MRRPTALALIGFILLLVGFLWVESGRLGNTTKLGGRPDSGDVSKTHPSLQDTPKSTPSLSSSPNGHHAHDRSPTRVIYDLLEINRGSPWFRALQNGPPLTDHQRFWSMVAAIKEALGEDAVPVITRLYDSSEAESNKRLFVSLLAALKDANSEQKLRAIGEDPNSGPIVRGFALYGLALRRSEAGWDVINGIWGKLDNDAPLKRQLYAALGQYGDRGLALLVQEAGRQAQNGQEALSYQAIAFIRGAEARRLKDLALEDPSDAVRSGAVSALVGNPSAETAATLLDIAHTTSDVEVRGTALRALFGMIAKGEFLPSKDLDIATRLLGEFSSLPLESRLALYADPELRGNLHIQLKDFDLSEDTVKNTRGLIPIVIRTLAGDAKCHALLGRYIQQYWEQGGLVFAYDALDRLGGFTDPSISLAASSLLQRSGAPTGIRDYAWRLIALGPEAERAKALAAVPDAYGALSTERERIDYASSLKLVGQDASGVLGDLLNREPGPHARLEIASSLLAIPSHASNDDVRVRLQQSLGSDIQSLMYGESAIVVEHILMHPRGLSGGLESFGQLIHGLFVTFASEGDIDRIRGYVNRLSFPEFVAKNDPGTVRAVRAYLQGVITESIDEIRARKLR